MKPPALGLLLGTRIASTYFPPRCGLPRGGLRGPLHPGQIFWACSRFSHLLKRNKTWDTSSCSSPAARPAYRNLSHEPMQIISIRSVAHCKPVTWIRNLACSLHCPQRITSLSARQEFWVHYCVAHTSFSPVHPCPAMYCLPSTTTVRLTSPWYPQQYWASSLHEPATTAIYTLCARYG